MRFPHENSRCFRSCFFLLSAAPNQDGGHITFYGKKVILLLLLLLSQTGWSLMEVLVFPGRANPAFTSYPGSVEGDAHGLFLLCQQKPKKHLLGSVRLSGVCG